MCVSVSVSLLASLPAVWEGDTEGGSGEGEREDWSPFISNDRPPKTLSGIAEYSIPLPPSLPLPPPRELSELRVTIVAETEESSTSSRLSQEKEVSSPDNALIRRRWWKGTRAWAFDYKAVQQVFVM